MDLVERYIEAVKFWLPAKLKDDVAAELKEDIRSQIEEAEREKGRPLTEDEVAALLKARGNPLYVASRYLPQRTLIGPELYPLYIMVLKIVAVICFIPGIIAFWISIGQNAGLVDFDLPRAFFAGSPLNSLLTSFAIVTIVFAIIEWKGINPARTRNWNPKTLRPVADHNSIKRSTSVGDLIANLVLVGIFLAGYLSQTTYETPAGRLVVSPEWVPYWQFIAVVALCEIGLSAANLFHPYWTVLRVLMRLVIDLVKTAAACWLLQSHLVRELRIDAVPHANAAGILRLSDMAAEHVPLIAAVMAGGIVIAAVVRLVNVARAHHRTAAA